MLPSLVTEVVKSHCWTVVSVKGTVSEEKSQCKKYMAIANVTIVREMYIYVMIDCKMFLEWKHCYKITNLSSYSIVKTMRGSG
jgi:hypothetical protein